MKLCLACSAGGHLAEMLQLEPLYNKHDHYLVTFRRRDSESLAEKGKDRVYFVERPGRNPWRLLKNIVQSWKVFRKERPDLVIATGADVTVASCWIAKLHGRKVVFIESFCRPYTRSLSGRLVHPIADLFIAQWKDVQKLYKKAVYGGPIF